MDSRGWSKSETRCLISSWAEESVQQKLGDSYHNRLIYEDISKKLKENGYSRTWLQCQRKIKHLKHLFRKSKDLKRSEVDRMSCPFYDELERVLGHRASSCTEDDVLDSKPEGSLFNSMTAIADAATLSNSTPVDTKDEDGDSDGFLPLSSFRLIVPPLQLVSAALWEIIKQGAVMYYGLLEDFVTTVLETVPELLTYTERVQLLMGLRAKVVLDLCRNDDFASPQAIQPHLSRINTYITNQDKETSSSEIKASMTNFLKLVHTLVDDRCQRDIFYQKTFPTVFGPKYDSALQALMRKFLFNLQKLLPVPNLEQTSRRLSLSPTILKECVDFMNQPEPLSTLIQHRKHHGHKVSQALSSSGDDCILSSLSYNLPNMDNNEGDALCLEAIKLKEENFEEINSELMRSLERNGQQHADDLHEDEGAFVEVILQPFDESESTDDDDDDDMDKTWFHHLKTGRRTSSKTFKCLVCGQDFGSHRKLKKHKMTHSDCFTNTTSQSNSVSQSSLFEEINLNPKPLTLAENNASRSEDELSSLASATTHNPSNLNSLQAETGPQCSTSLPHHFKTNPAAKTKESFLSETESGPSNVASQESTSSDTQLEQTGKRSSRAKQCSKCGKIFTCSVDLMRHMKYHTEQSPNHCSHCGKDFDSYDEDSEMHQEGKCRVSNQNSQVNSSSNTNKRNLENNNVSSGVTWPPRIVDTPANVRARSPMTCQECGQDFSYYKSFEKHKSKCSKRAPRRRRRTNTDYFIINACNIRSAENTKGSCGETSSETTESETAKTPASADRVDGSQTKSRSIKCTMCEKTFSKIAIMNRHYSQSHKVRGPYPCPVCKRHFVRLCELVQHLRNRSLYQCATCKKCFPKPGQLHDHEKIHTARETPRVCETCGRSFKYLAHLILHQRKHRDQQPSVCSYCRKQFSSKDCLKAHMVRHTGGYPCPVCGKKFNQKTYLKWHLYKHTGQAPYLCDTCGKGWPSAAQLKLHMIQHSSERPFKCEDCGVSYKRESHLIAHRRAKHIRLRPFVCEVCSKAFRLNNELRKHMMVHTGERPFTCPRCDKTFTRKSRLREHREKACMY